MSRQQSPDDAYDIDLSAFRRISWTTASARDVWQPRLEELALALHTVPSRLVTSKRRDAVLIRVLPFRVPSLMKQARAEGCALHVMGNDDPGVLAGQLPLGQASDGTIPAIHCRREVLELTISALCSGDPERLAGCFGWPRCCLEFHRVQQWRDATWQIATSDNEPSADGRLSIRGDRWVCNFLLRRLGLWPTPHMPCSFNCDETARMVVEILELLHDQGLAKQAEHLRDILNWPLEWSMLHGIVELKCPILKMTSDGNATGRKRTLSFLGSGYPTEGVSGVLFPYKLPETFRVSDSVSFQQGMVRVDVQE